MNSLLTTATDATATEETEVVAVPSPKATNATPEKVKVKDKDVAVTAPAAPMASKEIAVTPAPVEENLFEALVVGTAHKTHRVDASTNIRQTIWTRQPIPGRPFARVNPYSHTTIPRVPAKASTPVTPHFRSRERYPVSSWNGQLATTSLTLVTSSERSQDTSRARALIL